MVKLRRAANHCVCSAAAWSHGYAYLHVLLYLHGFKTLASNYLGVTDHPLFGEIETLLKNTEVSPAEIGEELMRSDDADVALGGLVEFINRKKIEGNRMEGRENDDEHEVSAEVSGEE